MKLFPSNWLLQPSLLARSTRIFSVKNRFSSMQFKHIQNPNYSYSAANMCACAHTLAKYKMPKKQRCSFYSLFEYVIFKNFVLLFFTVVRHFSFKLNLLHFPPFLYVSFSLLITIIVLVYSFFSYLHVPLAFTLDFTFLENRLILFPSSSLTTHFWRFSCFFPRFASSLHNIGTQRKDKNTPRKRIYLCCC